jgi:hypothetical protein
VEKDWLGKIVQDDELGLLEIRSRSSAPTADEHLVNGFNQINEFLEANQCEPKADMGNVSEFMLHKRLESIRANTGQCLALKPYDEHNLLPELEQASEGEGVCVEAPKEISSLEDVFADDDLGIFDEPENSIHKIRNIPKNIEMPDKMARRKRCENFADYESVFKLCHEDLVSGEREAVPFAGEQQIQKAQFFILNGVMCYVADMGEREKKNNKTNARLHLIFENGTESEMLMRSLAVELYKDPNGRRVMVNSERGLDSMANISEEDRSTGYIYVLKSLSENPEIRDTNNLYKIGYTTTSVEKRIGNASEEPTYLMAPVKIVTAYETFNMTTQKFENLTHRFFGESCLDIDVVDKTGKICKPQEWFIVPFNVIDQAINLIENGEIVNYTYDVIRQVIRER